MSDRFYSLVWYAGNPAFWTSSRPVVIGRHHTDRPGGFLLASNHQAPYDTPLLIRHCVRHIDFVSIHEVFDRPFTRWFYGSMNAFPIDRHRPDPASVRLILRRLRRGRVIGIFPEGRMRHGADSVVYGGRIRSGIGRIAHLAGVPIVPVVLVGSRRYRHFTSWLPLRRTRYGIAFGEPIDPTRDPADIEQQMVAAMTDLHRTLSARLPDAADP